MGEIYEDENKKPSRGLCKYNSNIMHVSTLGEMVSMSCKVHTEINLYHTVKY